MEKEKIPLSEVSSAVLLACSEPTGEKIKLSIELVKRAIFDYDCKDANSTGWLIVKVLEKSLNSKKSETRRDKLIVAKDRITSFTTIIETEMNQSSETTD